MKTSGTVTEISGRDWDDPRSGETLRLYSFKIENDGRWFRTGTTDPSDVGIKKGKAYAFTFNPKGMKVDADSISAVDEGASQAPKYEKKAWPKKAAGGGARDDYWAEKDRFYKEEEIPKISLSSARSDAVKLVSAAVAAGLLNLGKTESKKMDVLLAYVDEVRDRFLRSTLVAKHIVADLMEEMAEANPVKDEEDEYED